MQRQRNRRPPPAGAQQSSPVVTVERAPRPCFQRKPLGMNRKNGGWKRKKRQGGETNPLILFNETNGIVEQNQWNRSAKSMVLFLEKGVLRL
jgi:hypothetical protein